MHDWPDQTWALSRPKTLIGRRFHKSYPGQGVTTPLKRHNWSCRVPAHQALKHNEAEWPVGEKTVKATWPQREGPWRCSVPGSSSRTRPASPSIS
ncbi:winged helix-turn-helix domain-containing protein [Streptomyces sp. KHY 26]|uniref:winged helix-turn-helix domain-containing protein n=1 Tax=Streptomyces sp. KHY 26 TaxID=3097359 RepID=UPI00376ED408